MDVQKPGRMNAAETRESGAIGARARAGDAEAWGDLYREYAPAIFRFCRRALPTREDAEDATMEIFMKIRDKLDQYDATRPFSSWLYKVAANHCWDVLRRRKIRQDKETEDLETLPLEHPDPNQLDQLIEKRTSEEVRKALDKLGSRALEVSAHTQGCDACRTLLRAMERESRLLTRAMLEEEEPLPARIATFQERVQRSMQWVWMVAFGLAATAVFAMYTGYIEPLEQRLEQAGFGGTSLLSMLIFQGSFWKGWQSMISLVEVLALV